MSAVPIAAAVLAILSISCHGTEPSTAPTRCTVSSDTVKLIIRTDRVDTTIVHVCDGKRVTP